MGKSTKIVGIIIKLQCNSTKNGIMIDEYIKIETSIYAEFTF